MEKRYFNIDALNKYSILIPTWVNPEILVNVLAAIIAQEQGISMDYTYKKYEKEIRIAAIMQHEDIPADERW
jgi:hypothetical protein